MIKHFSFNDICMVKILVVAVGVGMTLDLKDQAKKIIIIDSQALLKKKQMREVGFLFYF